MERSIIGLKAAWALFLGHSEFPTDPTAVEPKSLDVHLLLRAGLTKPDLRLLLRNGYMELIGSRLGKKEWTGPSQVRLTFAGTAVALQILSPFSKNRKHKRGFPNLRLPAAPTWDNDAKLFLWGGKVSVRFSRPSPNLELLLNSLEKNNWRYWTTNPFHITGEHKAMYLLREAIKNWNYSRLGNYVQLHSDGAGTGFLWERLV